MNLNFHQSCKPLKMNLVLVLVPDVKLQCASVPVITSYGSYSEDMNYLLAILFTLVKILFIKGANAFIRPITSLIGMNLYLFCNDCNNSISSLAKRSSGNTNFSAYKISTCYLITGCRNSCLLIFLYYLQIL